MQKAPPPVVDPNRLPILTATGPVIVSVAPEAYVITFTQISPAVEGAKRTEAVTIARLALRRDQVKGLFDQFKEQQLV
jgi:hypothetical protein